MKVNKCIECRNETPPEENHCAICKVGITQMYDELIYLLTIHNSWALLQKLRKADTYNAAKLANYEVSESLGTCVNK
jgi:hypothetical protein